MLDARIRAFNPRPIAHTLLGEQLIKIHHATLIDKKSASVPGTIISATREGIDVATEDGSVLRILTLQLPGGKALKVADILNAKAELFLPGVQFTS